MRGYSVSLRHDFPRSAVRPLRIVCPVPLAGLERSDTDDLEAAWEAVPGCHAGRVQRLPSTPPVTPLLPQLASRCERSTPYHRDVIRLPGGIDVEGPIQAEVFVVWLHDDRVELTGPCGSAPWILEIGQAEHPVDMVTRIVRGAIGEPIVVHSTSWRRDRSAVILSFVVVIDQALVGSMQSEPVARTDLARSEASAAPREIAHTQVVEHGLRHLAWLVHDDPVVAAELSSAWAAALADYNPEPFRALG